MNLILRPLAALPLAALLLVGCRVTEHKDGSKENVDIGTPFGSMKVNTDKAGTNDTSAIGLSVYPGATPLKDSDNGKDSDSNNANVDMSFGSFHLGVKAATFKTTDSQDKVLAFYKKDLARYGDVITCKGNSAVGGPTHTSQGLSCSDKGNTTRLSGDKDGIHINDSASSNIELRAGSRRHQHIVGLDARDGYLKIGLVNLDLPGGLDSHDDKDSE